MKRDLLGKRIEEKDGGIFAQEPIIVEVKVPKVGDVLTIQWFEKNNRFQCRFPLAIDRKRAEKIIGLEIEGLYIVYLGKFKFFPHVDNFYDIVRKIVDGDKESYVFFGVFPIGGVDQFGKLTTQMLAMKVYTLEHAVLGDIVPKFYYNVENWEMCDNIVQKMKNFYQENKLSFWCDRNQFKARI